MIDTREHRGEKGFTLLEIMISLGILAVIFTLIYGTFNAVYRGAEQMEAEADLYRLTRFGIYHMANNLSMVYLAPISTSSSTTNPPTGFFKGEDGEHLVQDDTFPNDSLQFNAVSYRTMGAPESDMTSIKYALEDEILIQEMLLSSGKVLTQEIGGPIHGLNLRYFDASQKQWEDDWDSDVNNGLPLAVEIEFVLAKKEEGESRRFKTWIDIPMGGT